MSAAAANYAPECEDDSEGWTVVTRKPRPDREPKAPRVDLTPAMLADSTALYHTAAHWSSASLRNVGVLEAVVRAIVGYECTLWCYPPDNYGDVEMRVFDGDGVWKDSLEISKNGKWGLPTGQYDFKWKRENKLSATIKRLGLCRHS